MDENQNYEGNTGIGMNPSAGGSGNAGTAENGGYMQPNGNTGYPGNMQQNGNTGYPGNGQEPASGTGNNGQPGEQAPVPADKPKKKKTRFWLGFLAGLLCTLAITAGALGGFAYYIFHGGSLFRSRNTAPATNADATASLDLDKIDAKLKLLQRVINDNFLFDEDPQKVEDGIYAGMMAGLGDPYTVYYSKENYAKLNEESTGQYYGIGALLQQDPNTGIVSIVRVFSGSPAEKAGLKSGDILYKVDGHEATGQDLDSFISTYVKGQEGSAITVTVLRGDNREQLDFTVERKKIDVPTVESKMLPGNIGYIDITQFDSVTADQFKQTVDQLSGQGMQKLIIDLRDNGGGLVDKAVEMLDYMLPDGLLVYTADKQGVGDKYYSKDGHEVNIPTVLLVNGNSASASEIFAGAYKDFGRATLIGTKTFGKGIVQYVLPLGDGTAVKITKQHYYTPKGFDLHKKGIEPDEKVEENKDAILGEPDKDNQLKAAMDSLK